MKRSEVIKFLKELTLEEKKQLLFDCGGCKYITARGSNKGLACGERVEEDLDFCSKHKNTTQAKNYIKTKEESDQEEDENEIPEAVNIETSKFGNYIYKRKNDLPVVIDVDEQIVIGVEDKQGNVIPLAEKDYDFCKKFGWSYVELKEESSDESSDEVEELDEDGYLSYSD